MVTDTGRERAQALDRGDDLASFRSRFAANDRLLVYMDGNSLGRLPAATPGRLREVVEQEWGSRLIRSWGSGWWDAPVAVGNKIGGLVGAAEGQVVVSDSTTVNLYKLAMSALRLRSNRSTILTDSPNFPSDLYMLQGLVETLGRRHRIRVLEPLDGLGVTTEQVVDAIDADTALVTLSHVVFKSGALYDAPSITEAAHAKGALVLWDLSHSAGAVPVALDDWDVDFAAGCTYKYLNGGPGSPAFLYVRADLQDAAVSPIWGWCGDQAPFAFGTQHQPAHGIRRFLCGTPPVLSLLAMEAGVDLLLEAGIEPVRRKSLQLSEYLIELFDAVLAPHGFTLGTPREGAQRGSHVSIRHQDGYRINRALIEQMNVIPDFREPDNIRLGLAPLYTSFEDVWECVDRIRRVIEERRFEHYPVARLAVT